MTLRKLQDLAQKMGVKIEDDKAGSAIVATPINENHSWHGELTLLNEIYGDDGYKRSEAIAEMATRLKEYGSPKP